MRHRHSRLTPLNGRSSGRGRRQRRAGRLLVFYCGQKQIPALYEYDVPNVHDGGLMSYGPDLNESMERAAGLTARVLGGARPADLPFEEPTHYKLVINLKTAKATGIELPINFLALATEVIE